MKRKSSAENIPPLPFYHTSFSRNHVDVCYYPRERSIEGENSIRIISFTLLSLTICARIGWLPQIYDIPCTILFPPVSRKLNGRDLKLEDLGT